MSSGTCKFFDFGAPLYLTALNPTTLVKLMHTLLGTEIRAARTRRLGRDLGPGCVALGVEGLGPF